MSRSSGDKRIAEWLEKNGYHPRSSAHGSASCQFLLDDLLRKSEPFREAAMNGEIVYKEDHTVGEGNLRWNVDLVIGPPVGEPQAQNVEEPAISESQPSEIWLAIDAKSVMTEHQKARRNRQRDINGFADVMHHHYPGAVTGGLLLINAAETFHSPLRDEDDITVHDNVERLVKETVDLFRSIERSDGDINPNVDAVGCVVVEHTNMDDESPTQLVTDPPAPQEGDLVHYEMFVDIIAETFEERFLSGEPPNIDTLREANVRREELNERAIELVHRTFLLGEAVEKDEVTPEYIDGVRSSIEAIEASLDDIEQGIE